MQLLWQVCGRDNFGLEGETYRMKSNPNYYIMSLCSICMKRKKTNKKIEEKRQERIKKRKRSTFDVNLMLECVMLIMVYPLDLKGKTRP